jgi:GGDEF domain-containing protein
MYVFAGKDVFDVVRTFEWQTMIPAYLFVIMGLLLGEIREMANREVLRVTGDMSSMSDRLDALQKDNDLLTRVKEELQGRILSAEDPLAQFYESARKLSTLQPEDAYPALMELVARFTGAEKYGLYMAETQDVGLPGRAPLVVFRLRESRGWAAPDEFDATLASDHPAVARAIETRGVVTLRDFGEKGTDVVACAAMTDPSDEQVVGLLVINRIAFTRLTQMTLNHLHTIAGWAGKTLADSRRFEGAMEARIDDETTGTYNFRFLSRRLGEETARVKRYGGTCTFMLVRLLEAETLNADDRRLVLRKTGAMLTKLLRSVDLVGQYRIPGVFGIILPETSPAQSVVVTARVNEAFRREFGGYGSRFAHLRLRMGVSGTRASEPVTDQKLMEEAERFELRQGRA